jgi:hypothetical protein
VNSLLRKHILSRLFDKSAVVFLVTPALFASLYLFPRSGDNCRFIYLSAKSGALQGVGTGIRCATSVFIWRKPPYLLPGHFLKPFKPLDVCVGISPDQSILTSFPSFPVRVKNPRRFLGAKPRKDKT